MPREPIPRRAKIEKKEPTDYAALIQPVFVPSVGTKKRQEAEAAKEAAEKESVKPKKKLTQKQRAGKPTYARMIAKALADLGERGGSSAAAIAKHIEANHGTNLPDNFKIFLRRAFKKAVEDGILRHEGARYRLSATAKYKLGLKKRKSTTTKKKSSATKKTATNKKKSASSRSKSPKRSASKSKSKSKSKSTTKKSSSSSSKSKKSTTKKSSSSSSSSSKKDTTSARSKRAESRSSSSAATTTPGGYSHYWQYQEGSRWLLYDATASDVVEKAYQDYKQNPGKCDVRAVKSGEWQYQVDFLNNKQTNIQHANHTIRNIRRVAVGQ